jgi:hypothetical protein
MSDFVHDPAPQVQVINGPEGSVVVTAENSDMVHRTAEQTQEVIELQAKQAEEMTELNEAHAEANAEVPEGEPLEEVEAPVPYRASTVAGEKAAVEQLLTEGKITEEEKDERIAEIDAIAEEVPEPIPPLTPADVETTEEVLEEEVPEDPTLEGDAPVETDTPPVIQLG